MPFVSDADLEHALERGSRLVESERMRRSRAYQDARISGLRSALAILGLMAILSLFFARRIPIKQPGST